MTEFILWRHGRTEWSAAKRALGWTDIPLDEVGREQVREAVREEMLQLHAEKSILRVLTSPLERATEGADMLAEALGGAPVIKEGGLKECDFGGLEGCTYEEMERCVGVPLSKMYATYDFSPWGGERRLLVIARHIAVLGRYAAEFPNDRMVVSGHGLGFGGVLDSVGIGGLPLLAYAKHKLIQYPSSR